MLDLVFGGRAVGEVVGALGWGLGPGISCGGLLGFRLLGGDYVSTYFDRR